MPYANGPIHIGHLVEYIQTDIWVRFQKLRGNDCIYVCASDAHGTPIMLKAEQEGISPEALIEKVGESHREDFAAFHIGFDNYHTTHSEENRVLTAEIYQRLVNGGHIERRVIQQAYDDEKQMFLPDRYVRGTCPNCGTPDQSGDACENCSFTYSPLELIDAVSVVSGTAPSAKDSEHLFFKLSHFESFLSDWITDHVDPPVGAKLREWFATGLLDWDISRDAPYFGFEVPGETGKYFYVWLDAPVGYIASFKHLADRNPAIDFNSYWQPDSDAELYHFIGKDIINFHGLFWPAVLNAADFRTPSGIFAHGFLTVNGEKMSKRRGTFVMAGTYRDHLDPECLRYYYAAKLGPTIDDIDLNLDDFMARVNSDLVGKVVNIASRCAGFVHRLAEGKLSPALPAPELFDTIADAAEEIAQQYEAREFSRAMRRIMALADLANQYLEQEKPWVLAKQEGQEAAGVAVCTQGLNMFRQLMIYLSPVLPARAEAAWAFLGNTPEHWSDVAHPLLDHHIQPFKPLLRRIDRDSLDKMIEATKQPAL